MVSEVMLQQTQVPRVVPRYGSFLALFPTPASLAAAPTADVLAAWQGLGYNRRALALQRSAGIIELDLAGRVPDSVPALRRLPGVGAATAAAVCVYAFGRPLAFIETNIRSAFIHFFFRECSRVSDADLLPWVEATLDRENPREWYYALMDYGSWLKSVVPNPSRRSRHHSAPPPFAGSRREARGALLRALLNAGRAGMTAAQARTIPQLSRRNEQEATEILECLVREGFLLRRGDSYRVA